ncbi:MAG: hypothetical protein Q8P26_02795 [Candidatus Levybacteria bacterium]|nr:hypothetical protein [Candidatus Levybacteria bacterium]
MLSKEVFNGPLDAPHRSESIGMNPESVYSTLKKYEGKLPQDVWNTSLANIHEAFANFNASERELRGTATSAFFVHTRRHRGSDTDVKSKVFEQLDDSSRCLPILDPKYGMQEEDVELLWNSMPPFRVGEVNGISDGKEIKCAIISVPITPKGLEGNSSHTSRMNYARPRISQATELAQKMGAKTVGLGETLAALTNHGLSLQKNIKDLEVVTGHAFTVAFMNEITKQTAQDLKEDLRNLKITIVGAYGSIGSAMTEILLREGARRLSLHDKEDRIGSLEARRMKILENYPDAQIGVTGGNSSLRDACRESRIVEVAASAPEPFIKGEHVDPGTIVINDSQPPSMTVEEAKKGKSKTIWVVGMLPHGFVNTFHYGLNQAEWTCLLEVIARDIGEKEIEGTGPVNPERAAKAWKVAQKLGMRLASPQSWGKVENLAETPRILLH